MTADWQLSPGNSLYVADCGPYLGDWPPMAPFPQQLPPDSAEIDWLITSSPLADILDGTFAFNNDDNYYSAYVSYNATSQRWNRGGYSGYYGNIQGPNGGSEPGAQPPAPGTHVYLIWYAFDYGPLINPPVYPALSLIPPSYAEGGTATLPTFDTIKPLHQLGTPSEGVVLSRNSWEVRTDPPPGGQYVYLTEGAFGQPAIGILPDGSYAVAAPWFYENQGTGRESEDNNIKVKVWHLAPDLTVLGTLVLDGMNYDYPYPNLDVWGGYAGCTMAVNRSSEPGLVMVVVYNRMTDPTPTPNTRAGSHCWVIDCTGAVPVLATWGGGNTPRYHNERCWISDAAHPPVAGGAASDTRNVQGLGFPQLDLGSAALIISNSQQGYGNSRAQLFNWGDAHSVNIVDFSQALAIPDTSDVVAAHVDPVNPSSAFALVSSNGNISYLTDTIDGNGHHFALGESHSSGYTYIVVGGANPFEQNAVYLDHMSDDYNSNTWFVELQSETANSRPAFLTTGPVLSQNISEQGASSSMTCGTARVGPRRLAVADQLYSYQVPGRPDGAFKRVYLLDHSGEFAMDSLDLSYPAPIHPDSVSAAIAGSDNLDANADTIAVVSLILDNYSIDWADFSGNYPTLVVWTVPVHGGEEMAATAHFYRVIQDSAGNIIIGAQVSFFEPGTGTTIPDQLYADETLETKLDNPFISMNGIIDVYLERPRTVAVQTVYGNQTQTADYQDVLSNAENILAAMEPVTIDNASFDGGVLRVVGQGSAEWVPMETLSGGVAQILPGTNITVDDADPTRPIVNATTGDGNVITGTGAGPDSVSITRTLPGSGSSIANGDSAIAIGLLAQGAGDSAIAIGGGKPVGSQVSATGYRSMALGVGARALADDTVVIGPRTYANQARSIVLGSGAQSQAYQGIVIGYNAGTTDPAPQNSISIGVNATAGGYRSITIGETGVQVGDRSIALGYGASSVVFGGVLPVADAVAIGSDAWVGGPDSVAISTNAQAIGDTSVAVGRDTSAGELGAITIGGGAYVDAEADYGIALGYNASVRLGSFAGVAIGQHARALGLGTVAIGCDAGGIGASTFNDNDFTLGTNNHNVKIAGRLTVAQRTPSNSADAQGAVGDITSDGSYVYVKTATGWKRATLATFDTGTVDAASLTINAQTGTGYTLVAADAGKLVTMTNASASTLTVPPNSSVAFPVGAFIQGSQLGAGQLTLTPGAGVSINATPGLKIAAQYGTFALVKTATNTWLAFGRLST